jgi:hypothetical protein
MSISGSFVHSPYIQLQFPESLLLADIFNLLPVLIYVALRSVDPVDATMKVVKKTLSDKGIEFNQPKDWNANRWGDL